MRTLHTALGRYPWTEAILDNTHASPTLAFDLASFPTIYRAFAPMIREARFDLSEMAIATFLQARAYNKPFVLLPVALTARFQEAALLCRADSPITGPADLPGRRVGVRSYAQTTGMWLRGILADSHDIPADSINWTTFDDAHVPEFRDPPWATRAAPGADMLAMLRSGELDAAIFGTELPAGADLRTVFPDPAAAGQAFHARYGFTPVNHLACLRAEIAAQHPDIVAELLRLLAAAPLTGTAALTPALTTAARFCHAQGLIPRPLAPDDIWHGLPTP